MVRASRGSFAGLATLLMLAPHGACGLSVRRVSARWVPEDTAPVDTCEGPDMIPLYPAGRVPGPLPAADAAPAAKAQQIQIDSVYCHVDYPAGNVYLVREPALKPYLQ